MDELLTLPEAARRLGLKSPGALRVQIARGNLNARKYGRDWFITPDDLESYRRDRLGKRGQYDRAPFRKTGKDE